MPLGFEKCTGKGRCQVCLFQAKVYSSFEILKNNSKIWHFFEEIGNIRVKSIVLHGDFSFKETIQKY